MFSVIKESYVLFIKKFPLWIAFVLPLALFSFLDEEFASENIYFWMKLGGILILTLTELGIYKYIVKLNFGNVWQIIKKIIIISVYQVVIGVIMMLPIYIAIKIGQHHQILSAGYIMLCFVINIFLGGWFFAKFNAVLPLIAAGEKNGYKTYIKGKYLDWCWVSLLVYFPYVASLYLIDCALTSIVLSSLFVAVFSIFNIKLYQSKK